MTKKKTDKNVFCDCKCPQDPDEPCGKELPTYLVDVIRHESGNICTMITAEIEQMNTMGWPVFVTTKAPDELRDMILAAILTYHLGDASIDRHWARVRTTRKTDGEIDRNRKLN
jgi:hypothetical protein